MMRGGFYEQIPPALQRLTRSPYPRLLGPGNPRRCVTISLSVRLCGCVIVGSGCGGVVVGRERSEKMSEGIGRGSYVIYTSTLFSLKVFVSSLDT